MRLLSIAHDPAALTRSEVEVAAHRFLELGVGTALHGSQRGAVIIRSAELGAYVAVQPSERDNPSGRWVDAYWTAEHAEHVVDVTGAGNSFLGGVTAGLDLADEDVYQGMWFSPLPLE
jgi:sugar/nucleoside kinase (ribokinase family)